MIVEKVEDFSFGLSFIPVGGRGDFAADVDSAVVLLINALMFCLSLSCTALSLATSFTKNRWVISGIVIEEGTSMFGATLIVQVVFSGKTLFVELAFA